MLDQQLIQQEYGFLGDEIFLNVSQVVMPPMRVQTAYAGFMADYVASLGEGVVDFKRVFTLLKEKGYDRFITIEREIEGEEQKRDIERGFAYLKEILKNI